MGSSMYLNITNTTRTIGPVDPEIIFGPQRDPMYIVLPITITYSIIFLTGLFGNIFTCLVIIRNKSMHTATNYYLFSLAISDLLLLISGMPQEMYSIWSKWPYVFGPAFCVIRGLAAETSTNASVLTITLFTVERYLAICHPFMSHKMSKLSRATKHVVILWVVALALALPQALQFGVRSHQGVAMCLQIRIILQHSFEISTFFFFFTPMIIITVLYSLIGLRLRKSNVTTEVTEKNDLKGNMRFRPKLRRTQSQSTKRVVKMLVAVVVAFFVCWAPFHAQRLVAIYGTDGRHLPKSPLVLHVYTVLTYISGVFYYVSTTINPILYHIMSNKFRDAFKNSLLRCCRMGDRSLQRCSYTTLALGKNPASKSSEKSGSLKDGTLNASGIKRGSKSSGSDKKITFSTDCHTAYYKRNNGQAELSINQNIEKDMNDCEENKERSIVEQIYIVSSKHKADGVTQETILAVSDEPEVYIEEIHDRIKRQQKGYR